MAAIVIILKVLFTVTKNGSSNFKKKMVEIPIIAVCLRTHQYTQVKHYATIKRVFYNNNEDF